MTCTYEMTLTLNTRTMIINGTQQNIFKNVCLHLEMKKNKKNEIDLEIQSTSKLRKNQMPCKITHLCNHKLSAVTLTLNTRTMIINGTQTQK